MSEQFVTPTRVRLNASYSVSKAAYTFEATIEGPSFEIKIKEADEKDIAKPIQTNQAAKLATIILDARREFKGKGLPIVPFKKLMVDEKAIP